MVYVLEHQRLYPFGNDVVLSRQPFIIICEIIEYITYDNDRVSLFQTNEYIS